MKSRLASNVDGAKGIALQAVSTPGTWLLIAMLCWTTLCWSTGTAARVYGQESNSATSADAIDQGSDVPLHLSTDAPQTAQEMARRIDLRIDQRLKEEGWQPAADCGDAAFLRRAYLDLTGGPPKASEVVDFLESQDVDKRKSLVKRLMRLPSHAEHLTNLWSGWLVATEGENPLIAQQSGLKTWLKQRFRENLRYDRLLADLLVASGSPQAGPVDFFVKLEGKPEKIAAQTARVFMGVQLECAQCHDHPFDRWKQEDFWGLAAYFAQLSPVGESSMNAREIYDTDSGEVTLPGTERVVPPKPLVQASLGGRSSGTRRQQLTLWLTTPENPFLARAAVNRVWALLMGRGLVEPVDDMRDTQPASHPELLEEMAIYFSHSGYDLRGLIEAICMSKAYSRDTRHPSGMPPSELYAIMETKPLSEMQLANSLGIVARQLGPATQQSLNQLAVQLGRLRGDASQSKVGIVNALVTLHGDLLDQASSEQTSRLLMALQAPHLDDRGRIRWLFLSTLNRPPSAEEEQALSEVANSQAAEPLQWQSDLLWALLNSTEFAMTP